MTSTLQMNSSKKDFKATISAVLVCNSSQFNIHSSNANVLCTDMSDVTYMTYCLWFGWEKIQV